MIMKKIRLLEQTSPTECGLCCLYMIMEYFGIDENFFRLKNSINIGRSGLSLKNIRDIASKYGVTLKTYKIESLNQQQSFPVMLFLEKNHFIILEKIKKGKYKILDPAIGKYILDKNEFISLKPLYYTVFELQNYNFVRNNQEKNIKNKFIDIFKFKRKYIFYSLVLSVIFQVFTIATPFVIRKIIDSKEILLKFDILEIFFLLIVLIIFQCSIYFLKTIFINLTQNNIHLELANNLVKKIVELPIGYIFKIDKSDILHRYNGITIARELFSERIVSMWFDVILVISAIVYVGIYSFRLFILLFIVLLFEVLLYVAVMRVKQERLGKEVLEQKRTLEFVFSLVDSLYTIKSNNAHMDVYEEWTEKFKKYVDAIYKRNKLFAVFTSLNSFFTIFLPIVVVVYYVYYKNNVSSGNLLLLYLMTVNFINPLNKILNSIDEVAYEWKYFEKVSEFCLLESEKNGTHKLSCDDKLEIKLNNVSYKYEYNSGNVLKNISLEIKDGEFISVIGKSGCGKSTLAKILLGYEEVTSGEVTYNNLELQCIDKKDFRDVSSLIIQDNPILDGSIEYNISLNRKNIDLIDLKNIMENVDLYSDIEKMPMKFNTPIRRDNTTLSGGQKQRIALAREIISRPRLLVLDEPTSALDIATERIIQKNLEDLNCTRVLITHRLNTITKSDKIVIMDKGEIIDVGTHVDLYKNNIHYKTMFDWYMNNQNDMEE